ncbi:MAG: 50S ribosomal protein L32 [Patescibacteria group bacterium]|nr:50S ribosomal protein L32 [Patescibacteria group bacterium]MDD5567066.1 50S ribosomal protein L32 [Patescibacteria group bacterium]
MGLPGKKCPRSGKRHRLAWFKQKAGVLSICPKCKKPVRPHHACGFCGYYRGRSILAIKIKKTKPGQKKKEDKKD